MTHKQWLDNEYSEWVKALQESTVHNFKEHPVVKRMLGEPDEKLWGQVYWFAQHSFQLQVIDNIGFSKPNNFLSLSAKRMVYYAQEILKRNPSSICEIGGGVGQFYVILRALGWKGEYLIIDLPEVFEFQLKYLAEVNKQTGIDTKMGLDHYPDMLVSFYAVGEFSDEDKNLYLSETKAKHGYIAWNPHSGASDDLSLFKHDIKVEPGIEPGVKIITW